MSRDTVCAQPALTSGYVFGGRYELANCRNMRRVACPVRSQQYIEHYFVGLHVLIDHQ